MFGQGKLGTLSFNHHKESLGICIIWSLTKYLFAMGDPTRGIKPQTTTPSIVGTRKPFHQD